MLALVLAIGAWQTRHHPRGAVPSFSLEALDGTGAMTDQSLRGKPTMLVFWAPWCRVCKAQASNVSWVQRLVGTRARVVSVAAAYGSLDEVRAEVREQAMAYPVLLGDDATTARFAVEAFPTVFFLDAEGQLRHSAAGYTTTLGMLWRLLSPW